MNTFNAWVTRGPVSDLLVGTNSRGEKVQVPSGTLPPFHLSFLTLLRT